MTIIRRVPIAIVAFATAIGAGCRRDAGPAPLATLPAAGRQAADPALATDPVNGDLLAVWVAGDSSDWQLYFARSRDAGGSWSPAVRITAEPNDVNPHGEASPRLVVAGGRRLAVFWPRSIPVAGRQWPASAIRVARSVDGGSVWTAPVTVNDDTTHAASGHNFHGAAWVGDSGLMTAWLDERPGDSVAHHHAMATAEEPTSEPDAVVYAAYSPDFGRSWAANQPLWGAACPCCRVALARAPDGGTVAAWRQHYPGNVRDVVTARVEAARREPARVHADNWVFPGCPHAGPGMAVDARGARHVVWYTGQEGRAGIYYARVESDGAAREEPVRLTAAGRIPTAHASVVALPDGGAIAAYDVSRTGARAITVAQIAGDGRILRTVELAGSAGGRYPQLSLSGDKAVVAWTGDGPDGSRVSLAGFAPAR